MASSRFVKPEKRGEPQPVISPHRHGYWKKGFCKMELFRQRLRALGSVQDFVGRTVSRSAPPREMLEARLPRRPVDVQWEDEMGRYGLAAGLLLAIGARDGGELRPGSARDRLASANSAAGAGNGAGVVSAGVGRTERPKICFRRRHSSLCERRDGR